jgi:hypothetical protein
MPQTVKLPADPAYGKPKKSAPPGRRLEAFRLGVAIRRFSGSEPPHAQTRQQTGCLHVAQQKNKNPSP